MFNSSSISSIETGPTKSYSGSWIASCPCCRCYQRANATEHTPRRCWLCLKSWPRRSLKNRPRMLSSNSWRRLSRRLLIKRFLRGWGAISSSGSSSAVKKFSLDRSPSCRRYLRKWSGWASSARKSSSSCLVPAFKRALSGNFWLFSTPL